VTPGVKTSINCNLKSTIHDFLPYPAVGISSKLSRTNIYVLETSDIWQENLKERDNMEALGRWYDNIKSGLKETWR
jgi:hypothetical protein